MVDPDELCLLWSRRVIGCWYSEIDSLDDGGSWRIAGSEVHELIA